MYYICNNIELLLLIGGYNNNVIEIILVFLNKANTYHCSNSRITSI